MVSLKVVRASNASIKESMGKGLVAVFIGATSGIGLSTLKQFALHADKPKVYIIGRSKASASLLLEDLKMLNPEATSIFIKSEVSLMRNVDAVCEEIKTKEKKLDILFMSPGYLSFGGRNGKFAISKPS
jgi:NAD(P)-dependent dehydrogenase (short-subunit alcohol dehydrogenase family)